MTPVVSCGGANFLAVGGVIVPVAGADVTGLAGSTTTASQCAMWTKSSATLTSPLFVQPKGRAEVYVIESGKLRHVRTYSQLMQLNGQRPLTLIDWTIDTATSIGIGAPYLSERSFVRFADTPEVYIFQAGELHHVSTYAALLSLNGEKEPPIESLPQSAFASYRVGTPIG